MTPDIQPAAADEARFATVFGNLHAIVRYAAHRGSRDPEGIAAEVMTLAWRKLDELPRDDPRPWLYVTARNLVMAERRRARRQPALDPRQGERVAAAVAEGGDPAITAALLDLHPVDREVLLLVAWDDLTPSEAARVLGISAVAFRVRLHRALRRFERALHAQGGRNDHTHAVGLESA
jgi:RNA polymerase sigma-70 factor (ECF subfamily)